MPIPIKYTSSDGAKVEAVQWTGKNLPEVIRLLRGIPTKSSTGAKNALTMETPSGNVSVKLEDWIVREGDELKAVKPHVFIISYKSA